MFENKKVGSITARDKSKNRPAYISKRDTIKNGGLSINTDGINGTIHSERNTPRHSPLSTTKAQNLNGTSLFRRKNSMPSLLGKGGYGNVCRDEKDKTKVAKKFNNTSHLFNILNIIKIFPEFKAILKGPYFNDYERGAGCIVMDYIDGDHLFDVLYRPNRSSHIEESVIRYILYHMIHALDILHNKSILHEDIKETNIMMTYEFQLKLIDYDLMCRIGSKRSDVGLTPGTAGYFKHYYKLTREDRTIIEKTKDMEVIERIKNNREYTGFLSDELRVEHDYHQLGMMVFYIMTHYLLYSSSEIPIRLRDDEDYFRDKISENKMMYNLKQEYERLAQNKVSDNIKIHSYNDKLFRIVAQLLSFNNRSVRQPKKSVMESEEVKDLIKNYKSYEEDAKKYLFEEMYINKIPMLITHYIYDKRIEYIEGYTKERLTTAGYMKKLKDMLYVYNGICRIDGDGYGYMIKMITSLYNQITYDVENRFNEYSVYNEDDKQRYAYVRIRIVGDNDDSCEEKRMMIHKISNTMINEIEMKANTNNINIKKDIIHPIEYDDIFNMNDSYIDIRKNLNNYIEEIKRIGDYLESISKKIEKDMYQQDILDMNEANPLFKRSVKFNEIIDTFLQYIKSLVVLIDYSWEHLDIDITINEEEIIELLSRCKIHQFYHGDLLLKIREKIKKMDSLYLFSSKSDTINERFFNKCFAIDHHHKTQSHYKKLVIVDEFKWALPYE